MLIGELSFGSEVGVNIIALDKQPTSCPSCGRINKGSAKACWGTCERANMNCFFNAATMSSEHMPHVHVTCVECSFEFLVACVEPDVVERLL